MLSVHSCPVGELGTKDTGGMSVYIRELAKELGKQGHGVDLYTRIHGNQHPPIMPLYDNVRLMHIQAGNEADMDKLAIYPHISDFAGDLNEFKKSHGAEYDILHSHYWLSGVAGNILSKWWGIPHIHMFHTLGAVKNTLNIGLPEPDCRICNEKALVHACRKIIAPTIKEKQEMVRFYDARPESIAVIPCGVNQELFQPGDRKAARNRLGYGMDDNILLYVGRIEPLKGIDRIIQAIARLKDQLHLTLVIVGGDNQNHPEMSRITALCAESGISDRVKFAGRVDQNDLPRHYNAADALVVASLYESFGLVALEAMSCGIPVISTAVGGMKTIVRNGETGCLIADDTPDAMSRSILDIFSNREFYRLRSRAIRNSISRFSWQNIAKEMIGQYRSLVPENNGVQRKTDRVIQPQGGQVGAVGRQFNNFNAL
jgi:D-inositol-3-phosphate glycosyltransferase